MKKYIIVLITILATCFLTWSLVRSDNHETQEETVDKSKIIIADYKWNDVLHQISLAELEAAIAELPTYRQQNYSTKAGKAEYLEIYIEKKLKLHLATDEGYDVLQEHLKMVDDYTHQLMIEKLTEIEVDVKISITDEDLMAFYEENKDQYIEEARVRATCITVDDEDLANQTLDQIKAGTDIVELAKKIIEDKKFANGPGFSQEDPGNTGLFSKNASPNWSEFIDEVFNMEIGEMTEAVFETDVGEETYYMIFRKEEHNPDRQREFDEVKSDVKRKVERQKKRERIVEWVEEISINGKLKTFPENIPEPVQTEEPGKENNTEDK